MGVVKDFNITVVALRCCLGAVTVFWKKPKRISLQNLFFRVEYYYECTKGDVYIMGMCIFYIVYIFLGLFLFYVFKFLGVVN